VGPMAARVLGRLPGRFAMARLLGKTYSLRCLVFHNIADEPSPFTDGMRVSLTTGEFDSTLTFLASCYTPMRLDDVLDGIHGGNLPERALLVTFDDAYRSVVEIAAPMCRRHGIPAMFFANAAFLDNHRLAPDNLICYVANSQGMEPIKVAARSVTTGPMPILDSVEDVFNEFLPTLPLTLRDAFCDNIERIARIDESSLAGKAGLYLTRAQLRELASYDFEIGNHTYSHTHCRHLSDRDRLTEIDLNKAELEVASGSRIRAFSVPYGSSKDLTPALSEHLRRTGHEAVFLSESVANGRDALPSRLDRIGTCAPDANTLFLDLEILPRLRVLRKWIRCTPEPSMRKLRVN
jgi:peptidoglycan/xylan/chitin deacetylase (PgdA/CDA1 family)